MLGFFSSSAINVLSYGFASFLFNGGKMRLIINNILTTQDKEAIINGQSQSIIKAYDLSDIKNIHEILSKRDKHFFECLSYLIQHNRLELKIIEPKNGTGISHTKVGIFRDGTDRVSFDGSCNFSKTALIDNLESLTVSCDWDGHVEAAKVDDIEKDFIDTFTEKSTVVKYLDANAIKTSITSVFADNDIVNLLKDEYDLMEKDDEHYADTVSIALEKAKEKVKELIVKASYDKMRKDTHTPIFPFAEGPREYQQIAFENWKANNQVGLFAMATGTGKTITSLNCLLEVYKKTGYYKAIILVPTITLVNQWEQECKRFRFHNIIKVYSKRPSWKTDVDSLQLQEHAYGSEGKVSYVIIATYASFAKDNAFALLNSLSNKALLIADEAHNMGSGGIRRKIPMIRFKRRIGLSATPDRQYDEVGNAAILKFFGAEKRYTYEYSMGEAIHNKVLCRYLYYPHIVWLTDEEMIGYIDLSKQIAKYSYGGELDVDNEKLKRLLLLRKQIIHKATNKLNAFREIMQTRLVEQGNLKYTLVYVPEGIVPDDDGDMFDTREYIEDDPVSSKLIDKYTSVVRDLGERITVKKFTSNTVDRDSLLADFADGTLQVLTSMKCLDEGVDVPRSEMAVFCASTGNPRQFIQRRGRILRTHDDKHVAIIHDLVVVPKIDPTMESYNLERNLLAGELRRVNNFALLSENFADTSRELDPVLEYYNLSLF
jgi:superfamily II DNA or RNA helicase